MAYVGEARFRYKGPMALCVRYIRPARVLADNLIRQTLVGGVESSTRSFRYENGVRIRVSVFKENTPIITIEAEDTKEIREEYLEKEDRLFPPTGLVISDTESSIEHTKVLRYDGKFVNYWYKTQHSIEGVREQEAMRARMRYNIPAVDIKKDRLAKTDGRFSGNGAEDMCRKARRVMSCFTHELINSEGTTVAVDGGLIAGQFLGSAENRDDFVRRKTSWRAISHGQLFVVHTDARDLDNQESDAEALYQYRWGFSAAGWPSMYEGRKSDLTARFYVSKQYSQGEPDSEYLAEVDLRSAAGIADSDRYQQGDDVVANAMLLDVSHDGLKVLFLVSHRATMSFSWPISVPEETSIVEVVLNIEEDMSLSHTTNKLAETKVTRKDNKSQSYSSVRYNTETEFDLIKLSFKRTIYEVENTDENNTDVKDNEIFLAVVSRDVDFETTITTPVSAYYTKNNEVRIINTDKTMRAQEQPIAKENTVSFEGTIFYDPSDPSTYSEDQNFQSSGELFSETLFSKTIIFSAHDGDIEIFRSEETQETVARRTIKDFEVAWAATKLQYTDSRYFSTTITRKNFLLGEESGNSQYLLTDSTESRRADYTNKYRTREDGLRVVADAAFIVSDGSYSFDFSCASPAVYDGLVKVLALEPVSNKAISILEIVENGFRVLAHYVGGRIIEPEDSTLVEAGEDMRTHKLCATYNSQTNVFVCSAPAAVHFVGSAREGRKYVTAHNPQPGEQLGAWLETEAACDVDTILEETGNESYFSE